MLKQFKKKLRHSQTYAEEILWSYLRNREFAYKFRRQHVLQGYIVDFVCLEKKLIIELDGKHHAEKIDYDNLRTQALQKDGFTVLRFWNNDVFSNVEFVLEKIERELNSLPLSRKNTPHPQHKKRVATSPTRGEVKSILR